MKEKITELVQKTIQNTDLLLIDVQIKGEHKSRIVEIFLDSKNSLNMNMLAEMNHKIWSGINELGIGNEFSKINVSSPGVDRPFKYFEQLYKHIGKQIYVNLKDGKEMTGKLVDLFEDNCNKELILEYQEKEKNKKRIHINFNNILQSKIKLKF